MKNDQSWKEVFSSAIFALGGAIAPPPAYRFSKQSIKALRPFLPYCLHETGRDNFIWVNRDYKPLGIGTDDFVDYQLYPWLHVGKDNPLAMRGQFWLFGDSNPPWQSKINAERLLNLMELLVEPDINLTDKNGEAFRMLAKDRSNGGL